MVNRQPQLRELIVSKDACQFVRAAAHIPVYRYIPEHPDFSLKYSTRSEGERDATIVTMRIDTPWVLLTAFPDASQPLSWTNRSCRRRDNFSAVFAGKLSLAAPSCGSSAGVIVKTPIVSIRVHSDNSDGSTRPVQRDLEIGHVQCSQDSHLWHLSDSNRQNRP